MRRKTLDPGFRRDDGGNVKVASTTTVIPAKAGIQRLCFISGNQATARFSHSGNNKFACLVNHAQRFSALSTSGRKTLLFFASDVGAEFSVYFCVGFSIVVSALTRVVLQPFFQFFPIPLN